MYDYFDNSKESSMSTITFRFWQNQSSMSTIPRGSATNTHAYDSQARLPHTPDTGYRVRGTVRGVRRAVDLPAASWDEVTLSTQTSTRPVSVLATHWQAYESCRLSPFDCNRRREESRARRLVRGLQGALRGSDSWSRAKSRFFATCSRRQAGERSRNSACLLTGELRKFATWRVRES